MDTITVQVFQLIQWKHALALEEKGLRHSRGNVRKFVCERLALSSKLSAGEVRNIVVYLLDQIPEGTGLTAMVEVQKVYTN